MREPHGTQEGSAWAAAMRATSRAPGPRLASPGPEVNGSSRHNECATRGASIREVSVPVRRSQRYRLNLVACHEHGTALNGFLPASWDHLGCQSWDHPACLAGGSL